MPERAGYQDHTQLAANEQQRGRWVSARRLRFGLPGLNWRRLTKSRGPYRRHSTPFMLQPARIAETAASDDVMPGEPMAFRPTVSLRPGHPLARAVEELRSDGIRHFGTERLVQPPTPPGAHRKHTVSRSPGAETPKRSMTSFWTRQPWLHDLNQMASGKPGVVRLVV